MPLSVKAWRNSAWLWTTGGSNPSQRAIRPSDSMTMAGTFRPLEARTSSIFLTLPEMEAWTGEETKPPASPIRCPTLTRSPALTSGFAGAPMCMDMGMVTMDGQSIATAGMSAVFL